MSDTDDISDWAGIEFGDADPGDVRLNRRLVSLATDLAHRSQTSFPQALKPAQLKAACRFFDNEQADTESILAPHIMQTARHMSQMKVVLAIQDTTEFNLSHLPKTEGLGHCTGNNLHGFMMHGLLAVSPEGLPLGVPGLKTWVRKKDDSGKEDKNRKRFRPVGEKESVKWLEPLENLARLRIH